VAVYSGTTVSILKKVPLSDYACPIGSSVDGPRRYVWVSAQCGGGYDPVWVVNADSYAIVAGPITTLGVMGQLNIVNPVTGKYYVEKVGYTYEINPRTFKASTTSFGIVFGVDSSADLLYALVTNGLNIIAGRSEKIRKTVSLSYTPGFIGVNSVLHHIYLTAGQNAIEVRAGDDGTLLKTITIDSPSGVRILGLGADDKRARIYAVLASGHSIYLYWKRD